MAYELDIQLFGEEELQRKLLAMGDRAIMATPALEEIVDVLRDSEQALWSRGRSWPSNAAATIRNKGRNEPLVRSGALRSSLTEENDPNQLVEIGNDRVRFGSKLWYGHFALGTTQQPKREVIKLRPVDRVRIHDIVRDWILHGVDAGMVT